MSTVEDQAFCSVRLHATTERAPAAVGVAPFIPPTKYDIEIVAVTVGLLPDPAIFGLDNYTFIVVDPTSGRIAIRQPMVMVPSGEGAWGGTYTQGSESGPVPMGPVLVFASNLDGLLGPQVAGGSFAQCAMDVS